MEKERENVVTRYKITCNPLSSSQEGFEIENSSMAREAAFPVHEEYKLPEARSKFISDTNAFCNEALEDLRTSKIHHLQKLEQCASFLKRSELVLGRLKKRHTAFAESSNKCLAEGRRQLIILNKDCHTIGEDVHEIRNELYELISNIKK